MHYFCLIKIFALTIKFITEQKRSSECCSRGSKVIMCTAGSSASEPGRSCPSSGARSWCPDPDPEERDSSRDRSSPFTGRCRKSSTTTSPKTMIRPWPFVCFSWRIFHSTTKFVAQSRLWRTSKVKQIRPGGPVFSAEFQNWISE